MQRGTLHVLACGSGVRSPHCAATVMPREADESGLQASGTLEQASVMHACIPYPPEAGLFVFHFFIWHRAA